MKFQHKVFIIFTLLKTGLKTSRYGVPDNSLSNKSCVKH